MNRERFVQVLDAYGGRESAWPAAERAAMQAYLDQHPEARDRLLAARELDQLLDRYDPPLGDLSERIQAALPPPSVADRLLAWLFPGGAASLLRPTLAGAVPLLLGVAVGLGIPGLKGVDDVWESQERYLLRAETTEVSWYD